MRGIWGEFPGSLMVRPGSQGLIPGCMVWPKKKNKKGSWYEWEYLPHIAGHPYPSMRRASVSHVYSLFPGKGNQQKAERIWRNCKESPLCHWAAGGLGVTPPCHRTETQTRRFQGIPLSVASFSLGPLNCALGKQNVNILKLEYLNCIFYFFSWSWCQGLLLLHSWS